MHLCISCRSRIKVEVSVLDGPIEKGSVLHRRPLSSLSPSSESPSSWNSRGDGSSPSTIIPHQRPRGIRLRVHQSSLRHSLQLFDGWWTRIQTSVLVQLIGLIRVLPSIHSPVVFFFFERRVLTYYNVSQQYDRLSVCLSLGSCVSPSNQHHICLGRSSDVGRCTAKTETLWNHLTRADGTLLCAT